MRVTSLRRARETYHPDCLLLCAGHAVAYLGFSMMEEAESPRIPVEIAVCLDWENGFGTWDVEGRAPGRC